VLHRTDRQQQVPERALAWELARGLVLRPASVREREQVLHQTDR